MTLVLPPNPLRHGTRACAAFVLVSVALHGAAFAQRPDDPSEVATVDLMDAARRGQATVTAEGRGDGTLLVTVVNRTRNPLRVVLPSGLAATGASGRYGVLGGLGGGVTTLGRTFSKNVDAAQGGGLAMFGRLVTTVVEPHTRNMAGFAASNASLMSSATALRSVAPSGPIGAELAPGQSRRLATRLVSLDPPHPNAPAGVLYPIVGQQLALSLVGSLNVDEGVRRALERLASEQAASGPAQLVLWRLAAGLDWTEIEQAAKSWANPYELALAKRLDLDNADPAARIADAASLYVDVEARGAVDRKHVEAISNALSSRRLFGMRVERDAPARPTGPAVALRVTVASAAGGLEARVMVYATDAYAASWNAIGKFSMPIPADLDAFEASAFADATSQAVLSRLVRAQLTKGPLVKGKPTYRVRIDNGSPLILNGIAVAGLENQVADGAQVLAGISLPPHRNLTLPVSAEYVEKLGLKRGVRVPAADLGGL